LERRVLQIRRLVAHIAAGNRTAYGYDDATGRRISVTDALSNTVYTTYDLHGHVVGAWGATYPVLYDYDDHGRMTAMYTLRDSAIATLKSNVATAVPGMFVNAAIADLHLLASATNAIDKGLTLSTVTNDIDGDRRPQGASSDIGADEFTTNAPRNKVNDELTGGTKTPSAATIRER